MAKKVMKKYQGDKGSSTTTPATKKPMFNPSKIAVGNPKPFKNDAQRDSVIKSLIAPPPTGKPATTPQGKRGGTMKGKKKC